MIQVNDKEFEEVTITFPDGTIMTIYDDAMVIENNGEGDLGQFEFTILIDELVKLISKDAEATASKKEKNDGSQQAAKNN